MKPLKKIINKRNVKKNLRNDKYKTFLVSGSSMLSSILVKKGAEFLWKKTTHRDPPKNPADPSVSWGDAIAWTLVIGISAAMARLIITRNASVGVDKASS